MGALGYHPSTPAARRIYAAGQVRQAAARAASAVIEQRRHHIIDRARDHRLQRKAAAKARVKLLREAEMERLAYEAERLLPAQDAPLNMQRVLNAVSARHRLNPLAVRGERRDRKLIVARQECFWLCRERLGFSYPKIARFFHRDHTTILHGCRKHEQRMQQAGRGT